MQGSAGAVPPPAGYFDLVQPILRKYDILLVVDEVICGFGRTGSMWGSQTYDFQPDMITCGKALSAAMQPISALLLNDRMFQSVVRQSDTLGAFVHGSTHAGHPVAASVALETLRIYDEIDMIGHVRCRRPAFLQTMRALRDHPLVGDFTGVGLIGGLELVKDKAKRSELPRRGGPRSAAGRPCPAQRAYPARSLANRIAFSPPLIITEDEVAELAARLRRTLDDTYAELRHTRLAGGHDGGRVRHRRHIHRFRAA